jgi:ribosomal-protein-alanine N-acetyltransferase
MIRLMRPSLVVRPATLSDEGALARLLLRATCLYLGTLGLTASALLDYPLQLTAWEGERLEGYLGVSIPRAPMGKIEAMAIRSERDVHRYLEQLLIAVEEKLRERGTDRLIYIGQDPWITSVLGSQGFKGVNTILLFCKRGWGVPCHGNEEVRVRPATLQDIPALLRLDELAFTEDMWRNNYDAFRRCLTQMPHFVVAEQKGQVVGYQFSTIRGSEGYLARVAVHPQAQGRHIGARLLVEAIDFFRGRRVLDIVLNTQRDNYKAQRLYRWFGFQPVGQEATVLQKRVRG